MIPLIVTLFMITTLWIPQAAAGCIGPVIMGECKGQQVPWDSHPPGYQEKSPAPPGFYWDKRGTKSQKQHPEWINPFTGKDGHDSNWFENDSHK